MCMANASYKGRSLMTGQKMNSWRRMTGQPTKPLVNDNKKVRVPKNSISYQQR